jgi:hypothetical protein
LSIPGLGTGLATIEPSAIDIDATFALPQARAELASTSGLTAIPPATPAKLLVDEPRDDDTPLFSLLVVVKRQAVFWQDHLTAGAIATGGRSAAPARVTDRR